MSRRVAMNKGIKEYMNKGIIAVLLILITYLLYLHYLLHLKLNLASALGRHVHLCF